MTTLVVGAGYVGTALIMQLHGQHDVAAWVATRSSLEKLLPLNIDAHRVDLDDESSTPNKLTATRIVYLVPPSHQTLKDTRLAQFLQHAPSGLQKFVYISTSGVYGDQQGRLTPETTKPAPRTDRARRRIDAETQVQEFCQLHRIPWVILRVPGIYGPGRLPLEAIKTGQPIMNVAEAGPGNRIHRDDLALIIGTVLYSSAQGVVNVGDGNPMSTSEFTMHVARLANLAAPLQIDRESYRQAASVQHRSFLDESRQLDTTRLCSLLTEPLRYANPLDGIRQSLQVPV